ALSAHWQDGATVAISADLQAILLPIVAETLFDSNVQADVETVRTALAAILPLLPMLMLPGSDLWMKLPTPRMKQALAAIKTLDQLVFGLIKSRQRDGLRGDLLSMLLAAQDEQGGMSLQQVRDEVLTLLLAGHETTVNALTWTFFLLSQHPEVEAQLHDELDRVLKQRAPSLADIAKLPYTRMVLQESLRLYPPAWAIGRQVMRDIDLGGRVIATDSTLFVSQWVMHRDARYYHNPGCFDPQRWSAEQSQTRPKFAYFPFGAGSRFCIGERFAWLEMSLILATLAQAWQLRAIEPEKVEPLPRITLRPKTFLQMQLIRRV
ncbi:MAG TPA: cytochrome P450, partial [Anaerolineae bacterium]|nr:cytochrome P450 [Anaerolineae bacterium]